MNPQQNVAQDFDLAIVGGGMVGASLALSLANTGLRIALVEAVDRQSGSQPSYDDRTLVLNQRSCRWLQEVGLWPQVADAASAIQRIHVSARGRFGQTHLRAERHGLSEFGYVLQARRLGQAFLPALAALPGLTQFCPARLVDCALLSGHTSAGLDSTDSAAAAWRELVLETPQGQQHLRARLVVGADGADSMLRQLLALPAQHDDYQQTAVISNVSADRDHAQCAYERLTDTGPLALLPHGPGRMGLVWTVATEQATELLALSDEEFLSRLQQRFGRRLGQFRRVGQRIAYPLRLVHVAQPIAPRALLIGNAAHTIHPISAQGFNLGLRDAIALAAQIRQGLALKKTPAALGEAGFDPGDAAFLRHYQAQREPDQLGTIRYTDGLVRLYRNPTLLGQWLGGAALLAHHLLPPLQQRLVRQALGYRSTLQGAAGLARSA